MGGRVRSSRRFPFLAVLIPLALVAASCGDDAEVVATPTAQGPAGPDRSGWPTKIVLAAVPAEQSATLRDSYRTTLEILKRELGIEIEFFQAADYAGVIEAMIAGKVDVAQFGPFSYVIAFANGAKIEPLAAVIKEKGSPPGYQSYGVTKAENSQINGLKDFAGKKVCFVDPGSTSGFLYPSAGLLAEGIDPSKGVQGTFAGGHDASALAVANGGCEAGFAFDTMVDKQLIDKGDLKRGQLKVVWKSEVIAGSPVAVRTALPASFRKALGETLVTKANTEWATPQGLCPGGKCSFSDEGNWGYAPVDDAYYNGVRAVCRLTKSAKCQGVA